MAVPVEIQGSAIVLRRPQFRRVENEVFFLISHRPHAKLSAAEVNVWTALDDARSVDELRTRFPKDVDQALRRFIELGLCDIAQTDYSVGRRRVLVFEPHSDDAVLSIGGTMWLRRHECEFTIITIGSRSNFTSYYYLDRNYFNVDQISSLRNAEGELFARLLGGQHRALYQSEAALRYHDGDWSLDWYRRHKVSISAFIAHHSGPVELEKWIKAIRDALLRAERPDEVWFPLGGPHTDHELTRDACLNLLLNEPTLFQGSKIHFYQDVPYAARFPRFTPTIVDALTKAGAILVPAVVPIKSAFASKLQLLSVYGSQFKLDAIQPDVEACARVADGGLGERFWRLEKPPTVLEPLSLRIDEPIIRRAVEHLTPWLLRHRIAARIRLVLIVPAGRWAEDIDHLLQVFPKAHIDAYIGSAATAEVAGFESTRIRVQHVGRGMKAWGLFALRLILMPPAPTLFVSGEKRLREAQFLSCLWPMSNAVVLPSMDVLVSALRQLAFVNSPRHTHEGEYNDDRLARARRAAGR